MTTCKNVGCCLPGGPDYLTTTHHNSMLICVDTRQHAARTTTKQSTMWLHFIEQRERVRGYLIETAD